MALASIEITANPVTEWEQFSLSLPREQFTSGQPKHRDIGGFWSFNFEVHPDLVNPAFASDFLANGIMRHVRVYDDQGQVTWEGFINRIMLDTGTAKLEANRAEMFNRMWARYNSGGAVARSTTLNKTGSQDHYGIKERALLAGDVSLAVADQHVQQILDRVYWPSPGVQEIRTGGRQRQRSLRIECLGYWHTLFDRVWVQTALTTDTDASEIVTNIIGERADTKVVKLPAWDQETIFQPGDDSELDAVSPDWDQIANEAAGDFDSTVGTVTANAASKRLGTNGFELDISGDNFGQFGGPSSDTTITLEGWFHPNSVTVGGQFRFLTARTGAAVQFFGCGLNGDLSFFARWFDDSNTLIAATTQVITNAWHHVRMYWKAATAPGANDGIFIVYLDGAQIYKATNGDTDTLSVGDIIVGPSFRSGTNTGTIYMDEIQWSNGPGSPPWITPGAAKVGEFGMAFTITDTTARYVQFTDPSAETYVTMECWINPSLLTMAANDDFAFMGHVGSVADGPAFVFVGYDGSKHWIRFQYRDDGGSYFTGDKFYVDAGWHHVSLIWAAATAAAADDGYVLLEIDGALVETDSGIDNDTHTVSDITFGAVKGLDAGTSGVLLIDQPRWSDDDIANVVVESGVAEFIRDAEIDTNTTQLGQEFDSDRTAADIIASIASVGDGGFHKWVAGVKRDRTFYYKQAARAER